MTTPQPQKKFGVRRLAASLLALITASGLSAQQSPQPAAQAPATPQKPIPVETRSSTEGTGTEGTADETIVLSPFTVDASKDIGYYAENTLAGSRISTNVGDLASAITVVTKQQLIDTAAVDINDVFMYEANTEGANTYTQTDVSRNGVPRDTIAGYSSDQGVPGSRANANRVRGLSAPDSAINNYPAISRVPFDAYNTNSLEISRGPNSLLFGTGSPAGIVNQSTAQAILNKRLTTVEGRVASWDGYRVSLSHNQPLFDDKLAIYVSALYDDKGFRRKPSSDLTRRQYAAITYKPFKKTTITASFEHYDEFNNSPNAQTPRDYVTPWLRNGRPAYDPIARTITILDTGVVKGPYANDTRSPNAAGTGTIGTSLPIGNTQLTTPTYVLGGTTVANPLYIREGITFGVTGSNRITEFVNQGKILGVNPVQGAQFTSLTPAPAYSIDYVRPAVPTLAQWAVADRRLTTSNGFVAPPAPGGGVYTGWTTPSITDRSIYDWTSINLLASNYGTQEMKTWNVEFQQEILPNLNFSAGWFRQDLDTEENYTLSNANAITTIYVDTNLKNIDGTQNPYFGSPYVADIAPDTFRNPEINDNYRAILAYELDLTKHDNFLRFLGHHRLVGLWSRQDDRAHTFRYRTAWDGGDNRYQPLATGANAQVASSNFTRLFYVGQNDHGHVDYSQGSLGQPGDGGPSTMTASTYNWTTGKWDQSDLHQSTLLFYTGAYGLNQKVIDSKSVALSSYFWNDRLVVTAGWRKDDYKARATNPIGLTTQTIPAASTDLYVNGLAIDPSWTDRRLKDWFRVSGETKTTGAVLHAFRWHGNELSFHFNKSDNFNPPNGIPVDFYGNPLPKSTGDGKDYGFSVSMFDNKLVARVNWYESNNLNAPATAATTAIGRISRGDTSNFRSWAEYVVRIRTNLNGEANMDANRKLLDTNFGNNTVTGHQLTQTMKDEIAKLMGIDSLDNFPPAGINGTQTNTSKGIEFQMIYNPLRNWNIKATAAKLEATYDDVAPEMAAWLDSGTPASRLAFWQAATAPDIADFTTAGPTGRPVRLSNFWEGFGFNDDAKLSNATTNNPSWVSPKGFYESAILPEINVARALQGKAVSNARKWSFNVISNYAFQTGKLKGFAVGGGVRWADRAIASYYGNTALNARDSAGNVVAYDLTRPIYTPSEVNYDLWASYSRKILKDKVLMKVQFNLRDVLENGHLEPVAFNLDGTAFAYRIIDPRQFFLTTTFSF